MERSPPNRARPYFLYRGVYNLYFTSYNEENAPELGDGNLVTVQNGQDFMYTFMNDITVQPQKAGQNTMSVTLTNPFTRLCSQVEVSVKAASVSPVTVKRLACKLYNDEKLI